MHYRIAGPPRLTFLKEGTWQPILSDGLVPSHPPILAYQMAWITAESQFSRRKNNTVESVLAIFLLGYQYYAMKKSAYFIVKVFYLFSESNMSNDNECFVVNNFTDFCFFRIIKQMLPT